MSPRADAKPTNADRVYEQIRADIFAAVLEPGSRLKFPELCAGYGTSVGVAREALSRLVADRLVRFQPRLGYSVAELSHAELVDITLARVEIEGATFRLAVTHGDVGWESEILAAHHRLSRIDTAQFTASAKVLDDWYLAHGAFHHALLTGCPSTRMIEVSSRLREESELYRRWAGPLGNENDRDVAGEHRAILDAALERDADRAAELLRDHIARTTQVLLSGVGAAEGPDAEGPDAEASARTERSERTKP
ncbi:GntR family transcriptional regulator [Actinomadura syzygii]|uniref:FCD domain-containing protein n=1 Tax=Actinomadura syzygii TaxID=1427538 RepID=A0A5D0UDQ9_9ACTN|nr:FCD domain-containing protein [Actinomadura syzygii]TYC15916.1 FCD domain-containing protein [Actinomadura syzygii]